MRATPHRRNFGEYPLATLAAALAAGILLARLAPNGLAPDGFAPSTLVLSLSLALALSLAALATAFAVLFALKKRGHAPHLVVASFLFAGAALALAESREAGGESRLRTLYERGALETGEPVEVTGVVERAPEFAPDGMLFRLRVERLRARGAERPCSGGVEFFAPVNGDAGASRYDALELRRGARLRVAARLERADDYRNPGVTPGDEYLSRRDLEARATIKSPLLVERLEDERVFLPAALLDAWRARLARAADETFSTETAGVYKAAVLGDRLGLTRETAERFREGGTFHVLVISGLHMTFVGGLAWAFARRLTRRHALRWAASAATVWAYAALVGAEASVVRAALMFTLAALAPVFGRRSSAVNATGGAALALLVARPSNLFDPSFQLTFLSVAAIVALALPLLASLRAVGEWRPTRATPYPPACPHWFQTLGELLYWRERRWRAEVSRAAHDYGLFKTPWAARLERWRVQGLLRHVFAAALVSVVVQLTLVPLLVLYFHRLSPASPLLNIFVGALMVLLAASGLAALTLSALSPTLAGPFARLAEAAAALMSHSVDPFARAHVASLRLPEYAGWPSVVYALYFVPPLILAAALLRWRPLASPPRAKEDDRHASYNDPRADAHTGATGDGAGFDAEAAAYFDADADAELNATSNGVALVRDKGVAFTRDSSGPALMFRPAILKAAAAALGLMLFFIVAHPLSEGVPDGRLRVDFLDVGQGDSALVTMPDGTTLLVDGGGSPAFPRDAEGGGADEFERDTRGVGERVVSEYLWRRGLARVDYLVATHADADHVEGLGAVLRSFHVGALLVARAPSDDAEFLRLADEARAAGVPVRLVGRGDRALFGAAALEVLWPPAMEGGADAPSANDDSLVLRLRLGRRTLLLTGDAEARAEASLVSARDGLACDVLKAAHHGSRTSSTPQFVEATRPALVVISVGRDSPHGHPHAEVLKRWRDAGALVLTTGERGTITVSTDGEDLRAETFVK